MKKRLIGLDVLRALSAFIVFLFHSFINFNCDYGILNGFVRMGAIFMTAFFILSGFLLFITHSSSNLMPINNMKNFYFKRFISIIPLYYVVSLMYIFFLGRESIVDNVILAPIEVLGLQSVFTSIFDRSHNGGTWFISCMFICYFIYPFLQEIIKQMGGAAKAILIGICAFILLWSPLIVNRFVTVNIYSNPFFRCLEFFIGMTLAAIKDEIKKFRFLFTWNFFLIELIILITGVTIAVNLDIFVGDYMLYNWICLPIFILMVLTLSGVNSTVLEKIHIPYLSSISYAFFLAQFFTWKLTNSIFEVININGNIIRIILSLIVTLIIAILLHEFIEKPIAKRLKKFFKV